jgi:hypothetical protein
MEVVRTFSVASGLKVMTNESLDLGMRNLVRRCINKLAYICCMKYWFSCQQSKSWRLKETLWLFQIKLTLTNPYLSNKFFIQIKQNNNNSSSMSVWLEIFEKGKQALWILFITTCVISVVFLSWDKGKHMSSILFRTLFSVNHTMKMSRQHSLR